MEREKRQHGCKWSLKSGKCCNGAIGAKAHKGGTRCCLAVLAVPSHRWWHSGWDLKDQLELCRWTDEERQCSLPWLGWIYFWHYAIYCYFWYFLQVSLWPTSIIILFFLLCYNNCLFLKEMSDYKFCTNFKGNGIHICFDLACFSSCSYTVFLFFLPCLERDPSFHYFINLKRVTSYHFPYLNGEFTWPYMETLLLSSVKAILRFWNAKLNFYLSPILLPCLWSVFLKWGK